MSLGNKTIHTLGLISSVFLILVALVVFFILFSIFSPGNDDYNKRNDPKYVPIKNKTPKYNIEISGHIDEKLTPYAHLEWVAIYIARNPECNVNKNKPTSRKLQTIDIYPAILDNNNNYNLKINLDYYQPGYCNWGIGEIVYKFRNMNYSSQIYFVDDISRQPNPTSNSTSFNLWFGLTPTKNYEVVSAELPNFNDSLSSDLFSKNNYHLELNLKMKDRAVSNDKGN